MTITTHSATAAGMNHTYVTTSTRPVRASWPALRKQTAAMALPSTIVAIQEQRQQGRREQSQRLGNAARECIAAVEMLLRGQPLRYS